MGRSQLARHLYIHAHDNEGAPESWQRAGAEEWDSGGVNEKDIDDCYRRADEILAAQRAAQRAEKAGGR
jgi:hypothetical protein